MQNRLFCLMLLVSPLCHAERSDRDKPVNIDADQVIVDEAKQISTFTGQVLLTQGTMAIRGDKVVVLQDSAGFKHGTAYGHAASFRQKREGLDEYVEGSAERIEFDTRADTVDFHGKAKVTRARDEVRGAHINYNLKTEIFQADGAAAGGAPQRVHAVLHPKAKSADEAGSPQPVTMEKK